nr:hypothetical protein StreXyl84_33060 [Streptomyces sp. Xyl84]
MLKATGAAFGLTTQYSGPHRCMAVPTVMEELRVVSMEGVPAPWEGAGGDGPVDWIALCAGGLERWVVHRNPHLAVSYPQAVRNFCGLRN